MNEHFFYTGHTGGAVMIHGSNGAEHPLPLRLDLVNHSSTGFSWGYGGSGPAQLALALLAWEVDEQYAIDKHQAFKWDVISRLSGEWILTGADIRSWDEKVVQSPDPVLYNGCQDCRPPRWSDFSRLEVAAVKERDGCCEALQDESLVHLADFWSIYGRRRDDGAVDVITDAPARELIEVIAGRFSRFTGLPVVKPDKPS